MRECTAAQNAQNTRGSAPVKGVYQRGRRFWSTVMANGKAHYLGMFETFEEARAAHEAAAARLHGAFYRLSVSVFD